MPLCEHTLELQLPKSPPPCPKTPENGEVGDCAATIKISSVQAPPTESFTVEEAVESCHLAVSPKNASNGNIVEQEEGEDEEESEYDSEYEYYTTTEEEEEEEEEEECQAQEGTIL